MCVRERERKRVLCTKCIKALDNNDNFAMILSLFLANSRKVAIKKERETRDQLNSLFHSAAIKSSLKATTEMTGCKYVHSILTSIFLLSVRSRVRCFIIGVTLTIPSLFLILVKKKGNSVVQIVLYSFAVICPESFIDKRILFFLSLSRRLICIR